MDEYNEKPIKESVFLVDARENEKTLIALAHCSQSCNSSQQKPTQDNEMEESKEITEMTKDFSVCAKSFGHTVDNNLSTLDLPINGTNKAFSNFFEEDESAKDCF